MLLGASGGYLALFNSAASHVKGADCREHWTEPEMVGNNRPRRLLTRRCVRVRARGSPGSGGKAIHSLMMGRLTEKNTGP